MNAIYLCVYAQPWIQVSQQLESKFDIKPSYVVYWDVDKKPFTNMNWHDCYLQSLVDAWKGLGFPSNIVRYVFDEEELRRISYYELIALKMMDRLDPDGESFPFNTRLQFFRDLLGYWYTIVEDRKIKLVIAPSIPHRVFDYALYVVCKIKNIKFIMFQLTPFGSNSIIVDDIDNMPNLSIDNNDDLVPSKAIQDKITKVCGEYSKAIPDYMVQHEANDKKEYTLSPVKRLKKMLRPYRPRLKKPYTYWVKKGFSPQDTKYSWRDYHKMQDKRSDIVNSFETKYNKLKKSNLPKNFILVALHYQPEETSNPTGGVYSDQTLMIQLLNQYLPEDVTIIVKEHKSQFYSHQESASGRDINYYKRISEISERVKFVSENHDPFELIDSAQVIVTISGTIGWESAVRGTPTIIFGRAWYEQMPRVFKVKTKEDLINALLQLSQLKNKDLHSDILSFHAILEDSFVLAKHYMAYLNNDDVTMKESAVNIVDKLESFLNLTDCKI
ncbi:hypothetical protein [uncultured Psychrobacter sp.]|uniref:capsular polysaccharide export protein, LipB/KpsS family n=1 Tax=uncultured Psychrobacter sp. TaxID=259303 RepID=UPI0026022010|nr:hypothetical protein [uncultured Psychrobacter sp.]